MNTVYFEGKSTGLLKIRIIKFLSTIITLGILHPFGKFRELSYLYDKLSYEGISFRFEGLRKDFFKGFIKFWVSILLIFVLCFAGAFLIVKLQQSLFANIVYTLVVLLCTLLAYYIWGATVNGSLNYRLNNLKWATTGFVYLGKPNEMGRMFLINGFLSTLTMSLYNPWFVVKFLKYFTDHLRFGNLTFGFNGDPKKLFKIHIRGVLLSIVTLGIYGIWFAKDVFEYIIDNLSIKKGEQEIKPASDANTLEVFELIVGNALIMIFTICIGYSWVKTRTIRFIVKHCIIPQGLIPDEYTEEAAEKKFLNLIV
jgi:uncharacterized membrane protein YjgN (DUF898 family)